MITVLDIPSNEVMNKAVRPQIITLNSDLAGEASFRYLVEFFVNDISVVSLESAGNPNAVAHFDVYRITESYLETQLKSDNGFGLQTLQGTFSKGANEAKKYSFEAKEKYIDGAGNVVITPVSATGFWYQHNGNFNVFIDSYDDPFQLYQLKDNLTNRFLSSQREITTYQEDWGVLGCLNIVNSDVWNRNTFEAWYCEFFDASGASIGLIQTLGAPLLPDMKDGLNHDNMVVYIPLHWQNIRALDEATFDLASYYELWWEGAIASANLTEKYRVRKGEPCPDRRRYQIAFTNRLGAWEYHTFQGRNEVSIDYDRRDFNKLSGEWSQTNFNTEDIAFGATGGKRAYSVTENVQIKLNTEFLTEDQADQIYSLLQSNYLIIFAKKTNGGLDTSYQYNARVLEKKETIKTVRFDRLIQFTLNVEVVSADY